MRLAAVCRIILTNGSTGTAGEDMDGKLKPEGHHDGHLQDHQQPLQAHGHVTELHDCENLSQDQVHMDPHIQNDGEPSIDADGHVDAHDAGHGEGQVDAPSEGPAEGHGEGHDSHHHGNGDRQVEAPGAVQDDSSPYRAMVAHGEGQNVDGDEARRHEADAHVDAHEVHAMTHMSESADVGHHEVDPEGEHCNSSHIDSTQDEGVENKVFDISPPSANTTPRPASFVYRTACGNSQTRARSGGGL